jgi:hypothetical protein
MFLEKGFAQMSAGDKQGITSDRCSFRSFKLAWNILRRNRARMKRLAEALKPARPEPQAGGLSYRATLVRSWLAALAPDHPDRPTLEHALQYLERGEDPPEALFGQPECHGQETRSK